MQKKQCRQALLTVQWIQRAIHYIPKNKVEVDAGPIVKCGTKVGNKAFAHMAGLFALTALGVVALEYRYFYGFDLSTVEVLTEQLRQAGEGAVAMCEGRTHRGIDQ